MDDLIVYIKFHIFSAEKFQNLTWINCHTRYVPSFSFVLFLQINILNTFHHNDGLVDQDTLGLSSRGRRRRPPSKLSFFFNYLFSSCFPGLLAGYQQGCVSLVRPVCLSFTTVATSATDYTLVWSGRVRSPQDNAN